MNEFPPVPENRVNASNWDSPRFSAWSFRNMRRLFPTAEVRRGDGPVHALPAAYRNLDDSKVANRNGEPVSLKHMLADTYTNGFIALYRGRIVFERYFNGLAPHDTHLSQSVAKSFVGTLAGVLISKGMFGEEDLITDIVPELAQSGYAGAKVHHLLNMTSGVQFIEDYFELDPSKCDVVKIDIACGWKPPVGEVNPISVYDIATGLQGARVHGEKFEYRSIETDVLSWVIERASGTYMPELLSREIWSHLGAERDAHFAVDRSGTALADGGFCATLRDYARFAQMHLNGGLFNGRRIVPHEWVLASRTGDHSVFGGEPFISQLPNGAYSNKWWIKDVDKDIYMARGIYGQMIYIDPSRDFAAVKLSTWPQPAVSEHVMDTLSALDTLSAAL